MEHLEGIIDKENNPFICDSWIEQGYSCTSHRKRQLKKLIGLTEVEIRSKPRNEGACCICGDKVEYSRND